MLWHRAHPGQNRLWHLPPYPSESDRLLAGALYQPSPRTRPDEHRPLRRLKLANPVISLILTKAEQFLSRGLKVPTRVSAARAQLNVRERRRRASDRAVCANRSLLAGS